MSQTEIESNKAIRIVRKVEQELNELKARTGGVTNMINFNKIPTMTKTQAKQSLKDEGDTTMFIENNKLNVGLRSGGRFLVASLPLTLDSSY
jgi:hypothetical protein